MHIKNLVILGIALSMVWCPPASADRRSSGRGAAALGAVGAGLSGLSALMLMQAAASGGPDSQMLQMMAMMQLGQAAMMAASAAQNNGGANKSGDAPQSPSQPQLQLPAPLQAPNSSESASSLLAGLSPTPGPSSTASLAPPPSETSDLPAQASNAPAAGTPQTPQTVTDVTAPPSAKLPPPVDKANLAYDPEGKVSKEPPPTSPNYPPLGVGLEGRGVGSGNGTGVSRVASALQGFFGRGIEPENSFYRHSPKIGAIEEGDGAPGADGVALPESRLAVADAPFDGLNSLLLGGKPAEAGEQTGGAAGPMPTGDVARSTAAVRGMPVNIFQYASYRIRQSRVRVGKKKEWLVGARVGRARSAKKIDPEWWRHLLAKWP